MRRGALKGALYSILAFLFLIILPHQASLYLQRYMPGMAVIEMTQAMIFLGLTLSVFVFFLGYCPSGTVGHALAGMASVIVTASYVFDATKGGSGLFTFTIGGTSTTIDMGMIVKLIILSILLGLIVYSVEFVQATRVPPSEA